MKRQLFPGVLIILALALFELFNGLTTEKALTDILGNLMFMGISWATILTIAFCGIDFAGLARLFGEDHRQDNVAEWYLLFAWLIAAGMNALLTYYAVLLLLTTHESVGAQIFGREFVLDYAPWLVAAIVLLTRILLIGSFFMAKDRLFPLKSLHKESREKDAEWSWRGNPVVVKQTASSPTVESKIHNQFRDPKMSSESSVPEEGGVSIAKRRHPELDFGKARESVKKTPLATALAFVRNGKK